MRIVNQDAERIFLLEGSNLVENSHSSGHSEHTFSNQEHTAAVLFGHFAGSCEHFLAVFDVVMAVFVLLTKVQTDTVQKTSVALGIVNYHVVTGGQSVDSGDNSLISEVEKEGVLLLFELREHPF